MAYTLPIRRQGAAIEIAPPGSETHWLVCAEDGDEETERPDTVLGVFGDLNAATRWLATHKED